MAGKKNNKVRAVQAPIGGDYVENSAPRAEIDNENVVKMKDTQGFRDPVYVLMNHHKDIKFNVVHSNGDIEPITLKGAPVSHLRTIGGGYFKGGKFGITKMERDSWVALEKHAMAIALFRSGAVAMAETLEAAQKIASERSEIRHGYEPVVVQSDDPDPRSKAAKKPKTAPGPKPQGAAVEE